jgi:hypothetical protein
MEFETLLYFLYMDETETNETYKNRSTEKDLSTEGEQPTIQRRSSEEKFFSRN